MLLGALFVAPFDPLFAQSLRLTDDSVAFGRPVTLVVTPQSGQQLSSTTATTQGEDGSLSIEIDSNFFAIGLPPPTPTGYYDLRSFFDLPPGEYRLTVSVASVVETLEFEVLDGVFEVVPALSGSWFDPDQPGQGLQVEILPDGQVYAYWYAYDNAGRPYWLVGTGAFDGAAATLDAFVGTGNALPPNFDPASHELREWGRWVLSFDSCTSGAFSWSPSVPGFEAGEMPLVALSPPDGRPCIDDDRAANHLNTVNLLGDDPALPIGISNETSETDPGADNWTAVIADLPDALGAGRALQVTPHPNDPGLNLHIDLLGPGSIESERPRSAPYTLMIELELAVPRSQLCDSAGRLLFNANGSADVVLLGEAPRDFSIRVPGTFGSFEPLADDACASQSGYVVRRFRSPAEFVTGGIPRFAELRFSMPDMAEFGGALEPFYILDFRFSLRSNRPGES